MAKFLDKKFINQANGLNANGTAMMKLPSEIQGISVIEGIPDREEIKPEERIHSQRKLFRVKKWKAEDKNKREFQAKSHR